MSHSKKIYCKVIAWSQHFLKGEDCYLILTLFPQNNVIFLSANLAITLHIRPCQPHQLRLERTHISPLPTATNWNNLASTRNLYFTSRDNYPWLIFYFLKNIPVSHSSILGVNEKLVPILTLLLTNCMTWATHFFFMSLNFLIYKWT